MANELSGNQTFQDPDAQLDFRHFDLQGAHSQRPYYLDDSSGCIDPSLLVKVPGDSATSLPAYSAFGPLGSNFDSAGVPDSCAPGTKYQGSGASRSSDYSFPDTTYVHDTTIEPFPTAILDVERHGLEIDRGSSQHTINNYIVPTYAGISASSKDHSRHVMGKYPCCAGDCNHSASRKDHLTQHIRNVHQQRDERFFCPACFRHPLLISQLIDHLRHTAHTKPSQLSALVTAAEKRKCDYWFGNGRRCGGLVDVTTGERSKPCSFHQT